MRRLIFSVLSLALAACGGREAAPEGVNPQLEQLYTELSASQSAESAAQTEERIWAIWSQSGSPTVDVLLDRASAAETAGEVDLAMSFLDQASALAPNFAEPWNRRASIAYRAHDYPGAIASIQETLKREPRHFGALAGLGLIYEELGQERAALEAYRAALAVHPYYDVAKRGAARLEPRVDGRDA